MNGKPELSLLFGKNKRRRGGWVITGSLRQKNEKMERMSSSDEDSVVRNEPAGDFHHLWRNLIHTHRHYIHYVIQDREKT